MISFRASDFAKLNYPQIGRNWKNVKKEIKKKKKFSNSYLKIIVSTSSYVILIWIFEVKGREMEVDPISFANLNLPSFINIIPVWGRESPTSNCSVQASNYG